MNAKTTKDLIPNKMQQEAFKNFWLAAMTERTLPKLTPASRGYIMDAGLIEWVGAGDYSLKLTQAGYDYGIEKGWTEMWEFARYTERKAQEAAEAIAKAKREALENREISELGFALGGISDLFNSLATMLYTDAVKAALGYDGDCLFHANVRTGEGSYARAAEFFYLRESSNGKSPSYYRDWVTVYRNEDYRGNVKYEINYPSGGGDEAHTEAHGDAISAASRYVKLLKLNAAMQAVNHA